MTRLEKIKALLGEYAIDEEKAEEFIAKLEELKDDVEEVNEHIEDEAKGVEEYEEMAEDEEEHLDYLLNARNIEILKASKEGRDLILNAPKMQKEELENAIKKFLVE
jgi:uncharacterized protein YllA (UPF0747 family)